MCLVFLHGLAAKMNFQEIHPMSHPNGPYTGKEVAHLTAKEKKQLLDEARAFLQNSTELLEIIATDPKLRSQVVKNKKVRDVIKRKLEPSYSKLAPKGSN